MKFIYFFFELLARRWWIRAAGRWSLNKDVLRLYIYLYISIIIIWCPTFFPFSLFSHRIIYGSKNKIECVHQQPVRLPWRPPKEIWKKKRGAGKTSNSKRTWKSWKNREQSSSFFLFWVENQSHFGFAFCLSI